MSENGKMLEKELDSLRETLKQVSYQNQMMLKWVNGAVMTIDREGKARSANEAALRAIGWSEEELLGRHLHDTIHHSQEDGSEYPWEFCPEFAAIEDGSSHHVDGDVFWQRDGSSFSVDYIVCPTRDHENEITGAVLIFRNLTEQRLLEAKRIHSLKLESIGELAAGIAHEINTPIQYIGNNVTFLQTGFGQLITLLAGYETFYAQIAAGADLESVRQEIDQLKAAIDLDFFREDASEAFEHTLFGVETVATLVNGLKGFAHSGEGEEKQLTDLNEVIRNSLTVSHNAYKYVAAVDLDLAELPMIPAFAGDLGQVMVNLIVNAAHAIEDAPDRHGNKGKISIKSGISERQVWLSVADNGCGIPANLKARIFDPFFTTKKMGRGSGQGLAISRTIIEERHNGEIDFQSEPGKGTTFTIRLPADRA